MMYVKSWSEKYRAAMVDSAELEKREAGELNAVDALCDALEVRGECLGSV